MEQLGNAKQRGRYLVGKGCADVSPGLTKQLRQHLWRQPPGDGAHVT